MRQIGALVVLACLVGCGSEQGFSPRDGGGPDGDLGASGGWGDWDIGSVPDVSIALVSLTDSGRASFETMAAAHADWVADLFSGLDAGDIDVLMGLLAKAKASARLAAEGAPQVSTQATLPKKDTADG